MVLTFDKAVSVSELESWFTVSCNDGEGGSSTAVTGLQVTTPASGNEMNVVYTIACAAVWRSMRLGVGLYTVYKR